MYDYYPNVRLLAGQILPLNTHYLTRLVSAETGNVAPISPRPMRLCVDSQIRLWSEPRGLTGSGCGRLRRRPACPARTDCTFSPGARRSGYQSVWLGKDWQLAPVGGMIEECRMSWTAMRNVTG